jgi:hypothetical protein
MKWKLDKNLFSFSPKNQKISNMSLLKEVKVLTVQASTQKVPKDTTLNIKKNIEGNNVNDWASFVKGPNL